jgi:transcription-repair coupling factor (superfamily II helicase)
MSLDSILKLAKNSLSFQRVKEKIESGGKTSLLSGLSGSGRSLLLAYLFGELDRTILILTSDPEELTKITEDLSSFLGEEKVFHFPAWGTLPYDFVFPSSEAIGARLLALYHLSFEKKVVVASIRGAMEKTLSPDDFLKNCLSLKVGDHYELELLVKKLLDLGFSRYPQVEEVGSFSQRGGILDLFPYSSENPIRIEFFGDKIDSIREFSVLTQRTIQKVNHALILPKREVLISDEKMEGYLSELDPQKADRLREKININQEIPGLEWMGSLFGINQATILNYLPSDALIFLDDLKSIEEEIRYIHQETENLFSEAEQKGEVVPPANLVWDSADKILERISQFQVLENVHLQSKKEKTLNMWISEEEELGSNLSLLKKRIKEQKEQGFSIYILCDNFGQKQRLEELLEDLADEIFIEVGSLSSGFAFPELKLSILTDHKIFSRYFRKVRKKRFKEGIALSSYSSLSEGDFVVHIDFGIGRYSGLKQLLVDGKRRDCLLLFYQDDDKLYVPIEEFDRVHKFVGKEGEPTLSKLGGVTWEKTKAKTKKAIQDMAKELIQLYAEREAKSGYAFSSDTSWQNELESSFIYEETPDQWEAIQAIKSDMEKPHPMDRLVCGDVGYGKTEVGIRAAFKAVMDGKQVAVLVPTTILVQQHLSTFSERLKDFPVNVEMLSRFKKRKEQEKIVRDLKEGKVDIVIGTHRLLQKDIEFKDLGLVIVDEEQRFGVAHKEKLKKLKKLVDVLTLTATPIPRTMQLSLYRIRDTSVINTPPKDRISVSTEISPFDPDLIADATLREMDRGGQVYFVHNRVESMESIYRFLKNLLPQARIGVAHGQMDETRLEKVMLDFLDRKYDCLLATSIIESGLDIPNVNTIIINRADKFGLAQLYQLRGRVGRSNQKAFCYLLVPSVRVLTPQAKKRLKAIKQYTELGSGFYLSLRDLEIRGAGNILGPQQHGFIEEVGFDLYCGLLDEAIRELKGEKTVKRPDVKISVDSAIYIPQNYIPEPEQRVEIYKKIAEALFFEDLKDIKEELVDRFGNLPSQVSDLLTLAEIKLIAQEKQISEIYLKGKRIELLFSPEKSITRKEIEFLTQKIEFPLEFSVTPKFKVSINLGKEGSENKVALLKKLLLKL